MDTTPTTTATPKPANVLDRIFVTKVAVYSNHLIAGLGLKALKSQALSKKLRDPEGETALKKLVTERVFGALSEVGVSYGIDEEAISEAVDNFLASIANRDDKMVSGKVAQGDPPVQGTDGHFEYPLNSDNLSMRQISGVPPTSRKRWLKMVHKGETLVNVVAPEEGTPGRDVHGESIPSSDGSKICYLRSVLGSNTEIEDNRLIASCDGACEELASGRVRVVPEVVVKSVDAMTGSMPEAGVTKASILVEREIKSSYRVSSSENVFVGLEKGGGIVEKSATVSAKNLVVNGTLQGSVEKEGNKKETIIDVQELCVAKKIDGCRVQAEQILIIENCRFSHLDADAFIRGDGNIVGGTLVCRQGLTVAGDLGSPAGGSQTRVLVPGEGRDARKTQRLSTAIHQRKQDLTEYRDKLSQLDAANAKRAKSNSYWAARRR